MTQAPIRRVSTHPARSSVPTYGSWPSYEGIAPLTRRERNRVNSLYPSHAQTSARELHRRVLNALDGRPPRLVLEVGSFVGSGAVQAWGALAQRTLSEDSDGERIVICIDTWQGALMMRLGSHRNIIHSHNGKFDIGNNFLRRIVSEGLNSSVRRLPYYSIGSARLLFLLGYKVDVVYVDSAHELGETLIELHMFLQLLRPGGLLIGDDEYLGAVSHDRKVFTRCHNVSWTSFGASQWMIQKPVKQPLRAAVGEQPRMSDDTDSTLSSGDCPTCEMARAIDEASRRCRVVLVSAIYFQQPKQILSSLHPENCSIVFVQALGMHTTPGWQQVATLPFPGNYPRSSHVAKISDQLSACSGSKLEALVYEDMKLTERLSLNGAACAALLPEGRADLAVTRHYAFDTRSVEM